MTPTFLFIGVFIILIIILVFAFTMNSDTASDTPNKISFSKCTSEEAKQELLQEFGADADDFGSLLPEGGCLNNFYLIYFYCLLYITTNEEREPKHFAKFTRKSFPKISTYRRPRIHEEEEIPNFTFIAKKVAIGDKFVNVSINGPKYIHYIEEQLGAFFIDNIDSEDDFLNIDVTKINDLEITYDSNQNIYTYY